jgi:hypothetical protein
MRHSLLTQLIQSMLVVETFVLYSSCFANYAILQRLVYESSTTSARAHFQNMATSDRSKAKCFYPR